MADEQPVKSRRNTAGLRRGGGRPKGVPNKTTALLKDMILQALSEAGGVEYLTEQARKQPTAFLQLVGRVLPLQIKEGGADPTVPRPVIHQQVMAASDAPVNSGSEFH